MPKKGFKPLTVEDLGLTPEEMKRIKDGLPLVVEPTVPGAAPEEDKENAHAE